MTTQRFVILKGCQVTAVILCMHALGLKMGGLMHVTSHKDASQFCQPAKLELYMHIKCPPEAHLMALMHMLQELMHDPSHTKQ